MNHLPESYPPDYESPLWPKKGPREDANPDEVDYPRREAPEAPDLPPNAPRRMPKYDPRPTLEREADEDMAPTPRIIFR